MRPAALRLTGWRLALLTLLCMASPLRLTGQSLTVRAVADALHVRAAGLTFIEGAVADRLQDGRSVRVDFVLVVFEKPQGPVVARAEHSFNLSFDLWEQRFAVTRIGPPPRAISHLTARAAEAWCLDNITLPVSSLGRFGREGFWVRVEYRVQDRASASDPNEPTFTLRTLIDVLSRKADNRELRKSVDAGPFRLTN